MLFGITAGYHNLLIKWFVQLVTNISGQLQMSIFLQTYLWFCHCLSTRQKTPWLPAPSAWLFHDLKYLHFPTLRKTYKTLQWSITSQSKHELTTLKLWAWLMKHGKAHFPSRNTVFALTAWVRITRILVRATSKFKICILQPCTSAI